MKVVQTRQDFLSARAELGGRVGAVFTMGALHDGHQALLEAAATGADVVLATIFVNPTQFGPTEDLARYPRDLDADLARCERAGVDLVWAPAVEDIYPQPLQVSIDPGPLGAQLEGASRPTHFAGMLTVVAKLLHRTRPAVAYFGEKDYQQLTLIRAMVRDLDLAVEIAGVPTVREPDGLARSSRNVFLVGPDRAAAVALSAALAAGRAAAGQGAGAVLAAARGVVAAAGGVEVDYLELRDVDLGPAPDHGPARLLVAARVGSTRLIDNTAVTV